MPYHLLLLLTFDWQKCVMILNQGRISKCKSHCVNLVNMLHNFTLPILCCCGCIYFVGKAVVSHTFKLYICLQCLPYICLYNYSFYKERKKEIWPSPIKEAPISMENSTTSWQHKNATKNSITRLRTDLGQSVRVTTAIQLMCKNKTNHPILSISHPLATAYKAIHCIK